VRRKWRRRGARNPPLGERGGDSPLSEEKEERDGGLRGKPRSGERGQYSFPAEVSFSPLRKNFPLLKALSSEKSQPASRSDTLPLSIQ